MKSAIAIGILALFVPSLALARECGNQELIDWIKEGIGGCEIMDDGSISCPAVPWGSAGPGCTTSGYAVKKAAKEAMDSCWVEDKTIRCVAFPVVIPEPIDEANCPRTNSGEPCCPPNTLKNDGNICAMDM